MSSRLLLLAALSSLCASASVPAASHAPASRIPLRFMAPPDMRVPGHAFNPHWTDDGRRMTVVIPDGWRGLLPDEVLPGNLAGIVHEATGTVITFSVLMLADVRQIIEFNRQELVKQPGAKASEIVCDSANTLASYTIEQWTTDATPKLQSRFKIMVRAVPGKSLTPVLALGGWLPEVDQEMEKIFDRIVLGMTYE